MTLSDIYNSLSTEKQGQVWRFIEDVRPGWLTKLVHFHTVDEFLHIKKNGVELARHEQIVIDFMHENHHALDAMYQKIGHYRAIEHSTSLTELYVAMLQNFIKCQLDHIEILASDFAQKITDQEAVA